VYERFLMVMGTSTTSTSTSSSISVYYKEDHELKRLGIAACPTDMICEVDIYY
jgi:hypothetical protein